MSAYTPFTERPQLESAIDRYFEVEAEVTTDLQCRHDEHKARLAAAGARIDSFLALVEARKRREGQHG